MNKNIKLGGEYLDVLGCMSATLPGSRFLYKMIMQNSQLV